LWAALLVSLAGMVPARCATTVTLGTSSSCGTLSSGQTCTLTAVVTGVTPATVTFSFSPIVTGATQGTPNGPNQSGTTTITYVAPSPVTAAVTVIATATASDGTKAQAEISLVPPTFTVQVSPSSVILTGGQSQQFTAEVFGISATGVTWSLSSAVGSISSSGFYTAPATITTTQKISVVATSVFDGTTTGTASVTLQAPATVTVTVSPTTAPLTQGQTQQFTATVTNSTASVVWSISPSVGTIDQTGFYTAPSSITAAQKVTVTAAVGGVTATATISLSVLVDVGFGAPTTTLQGEFVNAFYQNNFSNLVALPPQGDVVSLGGGVYGQKFSDAAKDSGVTYALVTASATVNPAPDGSVFPVAQVYPGVFAYYSSLGASTAGAPTQNTQNCPYFSSTNTCTYQFFDKNYLLFVYATALANGTQNVDVISTFYTSWTSLGGFIGPGLPTAASATITASTGTTATAQTFTTGEIFSVTSGVNKGQMYGVIEPIYDLYAANGGPAGTLGLPTGNAITLASGLTEQSFEGGQLQYTASGGGTLLVPVGSVVLSGLATGGSFTLSLGQTMTLSVSVFDKSGNQLTGRYISWVSSSGQVVSVLANGGATATLTAVGGGTATIQASSGGISSALISVVVTVPCCQVGGGAPLAVENAFQTALSRNQITAQLPVPDPATPVGNGYVQTVQMAGASGAAVTYLLTEANGAGAAYVVTGALLAAYEAMGGPGGTLGFPLSDASAGGTQLFANGALAGSPIYLVTGLELTKWQTLGYETGVAGVPTGLPVAFSTIGANSGTSQTFAQGVIYAATAGPRAGQAYFVSGLILAAYSAAGGVSGNLGMPVSDETVSGTLHTQTFEGGTISYSVGATTAQVQLSAKNPAVVVSPPTVSAGGRVVFAISGFPNNHTVSVSVTGEPAFLVNTANGAYSWDMYVPLTSTGGAITVQATDTNGSSTASGTLTVESLAAARAGITKLQGDNQTGMPGATLPLPLVVAVADSSGAPVIGVTVTFQASPGAQLTVASAVTDGNGHAQTSVRLPGTTGVTLVTATLSTIETTTGSGQVTFGLKASASNLAAFPSLQQSGSALLGHGTSTTAQKGALLTAVASILQYHQSRGELPSPNGLATPAALDAYLTSLCAADSHGNPVCDGFLSNSASGEQIVNLWRSAQFTGGVDVTVANAAPAAVADLLAQGEPVLLSLGLSLNGAPAGGHFVTAIGVAADGSLVIQDPNPLFAQTSLNGYLNGFSAGGGSWQGTVLGAVRFDVSGAPATQFLAGALSQPASLMSALALNIASAAGACGAVLPMQDTVDASGNPPAGGALVSLFSVCDGAQAAYQISVGTSQPYSAFLTDLAPAGSVFNLSGNAAVSYALTRSNGLLAVSALTASVAANGIVNAATFTGALAPGGIMAIFGTGLSGPGAATAVTMDGSTAAILFASAFQVNAQIPPAIAPGVHTVQVKSAYGSVQQQVTVSAVAPEIFLLASPSEGAILNQDNTINTAMTPLPRGQTLQIFATGLGATVKQGAYSVASTTVTAVVNGTELPVSFAGLAPGFVGLYQVDVPIPATMPPGSGISLTLKQGGQLSNVVTIALQ